MTANVHKATPAHSALSLGAFAAGVLLFAAAAIASEAKPEMSVRIQFSGCTGVQRGPICLLGETRLLRLWVPDSAPAKVRVSSGGKVLVPQMATTQGSGALLEVVVPPGSARIIVEAGSEHLRLPVRQESEQPPVFAEAIALVRAGDAPAARALIEAEMEQVPDEWRGKALNLIGQLHRREGDLDAADRTLRESIAASARVGRQSEALKTATVLTFLLLANGNDVAGARELMQAQSASRIDAEGQYDLSYHRGLVAFNAGNARVALRELETAAAVAARMGRPLLKSYAESLLAVQLQRIGRHRLAGDLLAQWAGELPDNVSPCNRALHLTNLGWSRLLVLEAGETSDDPLPPLNEALSISADQCSANDRMNALTNLALAELHAGDAAKAAEHVARARDLTDKPRLRTVLWLLDIEARVALAQGDSSAALARLEQLDSLATATLSAGARWRAATGKGRVQHAMGNIDSALRSYAAADRLLDDAIFRVPLDAGRETLLTARASATREHIALLLEAGNADAAFALARRSRSRVLASLDVTERIAALQPYERLQWEAALAQYKTLREELDEKAGSAWMLPADELARLTAQNQQAEAQLRRIVDDAVASLDLSGPVDAAPVSPGELVLALHPLPEGWAVFAHDGEALTVHRSDCAQDADEELAACLLQPLSAMLQRAPLVRMLPSGRVKAVDFHALEIDGVTLLERAAVVYSADLHGGKGSDQSGQAVGGGRSGNALLVADGLGDLAAAREEMSLVDGALADAGWQATKLSGGSADVRAVLREIGKVELFHFAGHARFEGELGWDSELKLSQSTALAVTDILTLEEVPSLVVLSGCETGRTSNDLQPESVGLANAFLVAGAAGVIATARPVRDDTARQLVTHFYDAWTDGKPPHEALRVAQLRLRDAQPDADWAAYRIIER